MIERDERRAGPWTPERARAELEAEIPTLTHWQERLDAATQLQLLSLQETERAQRQEALAEVPDLWQTIYGNGPGFLSLFSGARPEPGAKLERARESYFAWPHETMAALSWIERESAEDRELYHCSHLTTRWRRRKADAAPLTSLYVDLDAGLAESPLIVPSVTVESSPSHYQAYFRLSHAVRPEAGEALNRRLAHALGADPSGFDLTQLLRIPGTVNHKYESRPLVRLMDVQDVAYSPQDLDELLPRLATIPGDGGDDAPLSALPPVGSEPPIALTRSARALWDGQRVKFTPRGEVDRSGSLVRIARLLFEAKVPRELIVAALAERDDSLGWRKYSERADARRQYERIVAVVSC